MIHAVGVFELFRMDLLWRDTSLWGCAQTPDENLALPMLTLAATASMDVVFLTHDVPLWSSSTDGTLLCGHRM